MISGNINFFFVFFYEEHQFLSNSEATYERTTEWCTRLRVGVNTVMRTHVSARRPDSGAMTGLLVVKFGVRRVPGLRACGGLGRSGLRHRIKGFSDSGRAF
ncbi:unnamed protein product [Cuscuta epithymum]|uniref:Uncharacterized protein n=1 Tax=Cuscuta epithymum TaxID=186058 RepID=A0AAV0G9L3_9ASTE|nr:unnamed protein product [Cuscuta epithymum]